MTPKAINHAMRTKRLKIDVVDYCRLYWFTVVFITFPVLLYSTMQDDLSVFTLAGLVCAVLVGIFIAIVNYNTLSFVQAEGSFTSDELFQACNRTKNDLKWNGGGRGANSYVFRVDNDWGLGMGQTIHIIQSEGKVLVNSTSALHGWFGGITTSFTRNRNNIQVFIKNLQDVHAGLPHSPVDHGNEWTFRKSIGRIVGYIFAVALIIFGTAMVYFNGMHAISIFGGTCIVIAMLYLVIDLMIITRPGRQD